MVPEQFASTILEHPNGSRVHIIGVSHISAYSGQHVFRSITALRPDSVVLEVDKRRYEEAAVRAQQWLVDNDKQGLVSHATRTFLEGSIWKALTSEGLGRAAHTLSNEGGALVEGFIYGSEVIMACEAASLVDARIVLADRSKAVSNARLKNALSEERRLLHAHQPEDDASLLLRAAVKVASDVGQHLHRSLQTLSLTEGQYYAEKLHPIFLIAERPHYKRVLDGAGCSDPDALVAALTRMMTHGSSPGGAICPRDLQLVQHAIARIERQKQALRRRLFAPRAGAGPAAAATESHAIACSTCLLCEGARDDADAFVEEFCRGVGAYACGCAGLGHATPTTAVDSPAATAPAFSALWRRVFAVWMDHDATAVHDGTDPFFQWCWRGVAHAHARLRAPVVSTADGACCPTADARGAAEPCAVGLSPYYRTVVHERDTILATRLWDEATLSGGGTVVAVVGANHIPGIVRNWAHAGSDAMRRRCVEYLTPPPGVGDAPGGGSVAWQEGAWQEGAVQVASCAMTGLLFAGLAYAPARIVAHRLGGARRPLGWGVSVAALPGVALAGLSAGAAVCDAWRMSRVAQLVHNLAALPTNFANFTSAD